MERTHYSVGSQGLERLNSRNEPEPSRFVKAIGHIISYVFHPLFIPTFVCYYLLFVNPLVFAGYSEETKTFRLISVAFTTAVLPAFSVFIMWRLKLAISSMQLKTQRERIIPYAITMFCFFWCWYVFKNVSSPWEIQLFLLGAFLSVCAAWLLNIPMRVSMHTTAMGAVLAYFMILAFKDPTFYGTYLTMVIFIVGLVCTARLIVSHHTYGEIYIGLMAGILSQLVATWFV